MPFENQEATVKAIAALAPLISSGLILVDSANVIIFASKMQKWLRVPSETLKGVQITDYFAIDATTLPLGEIQLILPLDPTGTVQANVFRLEGEINLTVLIFPFGGEMLGLKDLELLARIQTKKMRNAIARKVAASGGLLGFGVWVLSQVTPLGTALKGAIAAWRWDSAQPSIDRRAIGVYEKIGEERRFLNSILIRDLLKQEFPNVIAVAYFAAQSRNYENIYLRYITDSGATSNNAEGVEVWFDSLSLPRTEFQKLEQFDCVLWPNGAYFPKDPHLGNKPNPKRLDVILCPVVALRPDAENPALLSYQLVGISGLGVRNTGKPTQLEPYAYKLWRLTPNLESLY